MSKNSAVKTYKTAVRNINAYTAHQQEQNPRTFEAGYDTEEYSRLEQLVVEAERHVPWYRSL